MAGYRDISSRLARWSGSVWNFTRKLDAGDEPYLSYSKLTSLEFCSYRYFLEYVKRVRVKPEPSYFAKGRLFHEAAAKVYGTIAARKEIDVQSLHAMLDKRAEDDDAVHLKNALHLCVVHAHRDWEIVSIEQPFVLSMGSTLPPLIGIIDLVLKKERTFAVIDHKTGRNFNDLDRLQLAVYRQHILREHRATDCVAFYDEYRWVNNLDRVRKPAFQRTEVKLASHPWQRTLKRFAAGFKKMKKIEAEQDAPDGGPCMVCPFKDICPKASFGYTGYGW